MKNSNRHNRILNRLLVLLIAPFLKWIFRFRFAKQKFDGPTLVICNHVTNFDPLLVSICFPKDHMHFVASEHLFRKGLLTRFLKYVFDPIPRRKGTKGADTAMACLRKLKQGRSVCIFAEGECTWDGVTADIVSSTGRLAKMSGATLLTCRLEGGYLTAPRWGKGVRPGKMTFRVVTTYSPEQLKAMDGAEIEARMQADIHYDTWQAQQEHPVAYRSRRRAENLQTVLYMCPECHQVGKLRSKGKFLSCSCGAKWEYTPFGSFAPAQPFSNIAQWDAWQSRQLGEQLPKITLRDEEVTVFALGADHQQMELTTDVLILEDGILRCGDQQWKLADIDDLALVQSKNLLLSCTDRYYQLHSAQSCCLRKYRAAWQHARNASAQSAEHTTSKTPSC